MRRILFFNLKNKRRNLLGITSKSYVNIMTMNSETKST